jgi:hypothetical protein
MKIRLYRFVYALNPVQDRDEGVEVLVDSQSAKTSGVGAPRKCTERSLRVHIYSVCHKYCPNVGCRSIGLHSLSEHPYSFSEF